MWDLNRAERKAVGTALVLVGLGLVSRAALAPDPGRVEGIAPIAGRGSLRGIEGEVVSALVREQRAQTPLADGERIDLNSASAEEIRRLPGVGQSVAQAIIEERSRTPFAEAGDLQRVSGIGEVTARRLAPHVSFGPATPRPGMAPRAPPSGSPNPFGASGRSAEPAALAARPLASGATAGCPSGGNLIDVNSAANAELESLPGVGAVLASRIIEDRRTNGPFRTADDLVRVSGIGKVSLARLADRICAGGR